MRKLNWLSVTEQWYKENIATLSMFVVLLRVIFFRELPLVVDFLVVAMMLLGFAALLSIKCPYCKKSPLAKVISDSSFNSWAYKFNSLEECPNCSMRLIPEEPCSDQGNDRSP
jgi:hypothetical protein